MFEIKYKEVLTESRSVRITRLDVLAPDIAKKVKAGQFVVIMAAEVGERIPLTVVNKDLKKGFITLIFQEAGYSTKLLGKLEVGSSLYTLVGPLGHFTEIRRYGQVVLVGGGVGIAEIYPVAGALKDGGNKITTIIGARTKDLLILEKELESLSDQIHIATDDGSYGREGFVTDILKDLLPDALSPTPYSLVYAVGPIPMMEEVSAVTRGPGVKTIVSLNALMVDATGMCGCCRVTVENKVKFSCIDGPEFDAHLVDWQELAKRVKIYEDKEKHICNFYNL